MGNVIKRAGAVLAGALAVGAITLGAQSATTAHHSSSVAAVSPANTDPAPDTISI